jgi:predicted nuclease of predicted toxin-antitoxin system
LKFKVDENLPTEYAPILREAGFEADTVSDEKLSGAGDSVLSERCCTEDLTLDLDFANVQAYPPKSHPGIVVFRSNIRPSWQRFVNFRLAEKSGWRGGVRLQKRHVCSHYLGRIDKKWPI